jgi:hypothetical protein
MLVAHAATASWRFLSKKSVMDADKCARMCIWLSLGADEELREMLEELARIWVRAAIRRETSVPTRVSIQTGIMRDR